MAQYYPALGKMVFNFGSPITVDQIQSASSTLGSNVISEFYLNFCSATNAPILQGIVPWLTTYTGNYDVTVKTLIVKNQLVPRYTGDKPVITVTVDQILYTVNAGDTSYIPLNALSQNFAIASQCTNQTRDVLVKGNPDCLIYITTESYGSAYLQRQGTPPALCKYSEAVSSQSYMSIGSDNENPDGGYVITDVNGNLLSNTNNSFIITPDVFFGWSFAPQFDAATPFPAVTIAQGGGDVELLWFKVSVPALMDFSDDPNETGTPLHGYGKVGYVDPGGTGATRFMQEYWASVSLDYYTGFSPSKLLLPFGSINPQFFQQHPILLQLPNFQGKKGLFFGSTPRALFPFYFYNSGYTPYVVPKNPIYVSVASAVFLY